MRFPVRFLIAALVVLIPAAPAERKSSVKAVGKPRNAGVFIDGKYAGPASRFMLPQKYEVEPGSREIVLRDPRFEDFSVRAEVAPGKTVTVRYSMRPLPLPAGPFGMLRLSGGASGDIGAVYINGRFFGHIDELNNRGSGILLPPGTYSVRITSPRFHEINQDVTIRPGKTTLLPLPLK